MASVKTTAPLSQPGERLLRLTRLLAPLLLALPLLAACGQGSPLASVSMSPNTIQPNDQSTNRLAGLHYVLTRRADISISFVGPDGATHVLRDRQTRAPGPYTLQFDGTYDGHVLPNGVYHWQVMASDPTSRAVLAKQNATLTIADAQTAGPQIRQPLVFPNPFQPNGNLATDTATFTYNLSKPAQVSIVAVGPRGSAAAQTYQVLYQDNEKAGPNQATWTGQISPEQYVPDGVYDWTIEAQDVAGNVAKATGTVQVTDSGIADARVEEVKATPTQLNGQRVIEVQVRIYNSGLATLVGDAQAPAPQQGYVYPSLESTYRMSAPYGPGWGEEAFGRAGTYSVGVSYLERDNVPNQVPYPYRWSIGGPLKPKESRVITGYIAVPASFHGQLSFYAGIIHEGQGILSGQDHIPALQKTVLP